VQLSDNYSSNLVVGVLFLQLTILADQFVILNQSLAPEAVEKPGVARPLIIPKYDEVGLDIISTLIRTAGITRDAFLTLSANC
jgi:hypothetical protein